MRKNESKKLVTKEPHRQAE